MEEQNIGELESENTNENLTAFEQLVETAVIRDFDLDAETRARGASQQKIFNELALKERPQINVTAIKWRDIFQLAGMIVISMVAIALIGQLLGPRGRVEGEFDQQFAQVFWKIDELASESETQIWDQALQDLDEISF